MKALFLSAALMAATLGAKAQFSVGIAPEAGVNLASMTNKFDFGSGEQSERSTTNVGVRAGVSFNLGIGEQLAIQPGIFYSQKGGKFDRDVAGAKYNDEFRVNYIEVPVNVVYHTNNNQTGFFLFAGPHIAVCINGKYKNSGYTNGPITIAAENRDLNVGGDEAKDDFKRLDYGVQGGAGYQTAMGLLFRAQYIHGLHNVSATNVADNRFQNRSIALTIGYRLGGK